jgi:hypothetical protein
MTAPISIMACFARKCRSPIGIWNLYFIIIRYGDTVFCPGDLACAHSRIRNAISVECTGKINRSVTAACQQRGLSKGIFPSWRHACDASKIRVVLRQVLLLFAHFLIPKEHLFKCSSTVDWYKYDAKWSIVA